MFKQRMVSRGYITTSSIDKLLLLKMVMKVSDVSNPLRTLAVSKFWTRAILTEFYAQGDLEREQGLAISPMCDRFHPTLAKSQHIVSLILL
jgi:cAMP-specific phosphodiesterase 4